MYLSQVRAKKTTPALQAGRVSLSEGAALAAVTDEECRNLVVCTPWGYHWRPPLGQEVLVMKDDEGRRHIVGVPSAPQAKPGDILIAGPKASVRVAADGLIELTGRVMINGKEWTG